MKHKDYYVTLIVTLYDDEEPTNENILPMLEGLEYDDLIDSLISIDEK